MNLLRVSSGVTINLDHVTSVVTLDDGSMVVNFDFALLEIGEKGDEQEIEAFLYLEGDDASNLRAYLQRTVPSTAEPRGEDA